MKKEEYVPTLREYAEVIQWLHDNLGKAIPVNLIKPLNDALNRADLSRFGQLLKELL